MNLENFKQNIDIIDVISAFVPLKKQGSKYWANCPFHSEKSPSFCVDSLKGFYKCFGCGEGGDAIKFVMKYKNLEFKDACLQIASICNLSIDFEGKKIDTSALEAAKRIYTQAFHASPAYNYALKRGVSEEMMAKFELGFGAHIENKEAKYNFKAFEKRLILPIYMPSGNRLAGFGGRDLSGVSKAKYINSPQSEFFNKSTLIYALHLARESITKKQRVFIVEGYLDCILAHQNGICESVAPLGTALSKENLIRLSKLTPNIILAFDKDNAGLKATLRAIHLCLELELDNAKVLLLDTKEKDLADFFTKEKEAKTKFENAKLISIFDFYILYLMKDFKQKALLEQQFAINELKGFLARIKSNFLKNAYKNKILEKYGFEKNVLDEKAAKMPLKVAFKGIKNINEASILKLASEDAKSLDYLKTFLLESDFKDYKEDFKSLVTGGKLVNEYEILSVETQGFELRWAILQKLKARYEKELSKLSQQSDTNKAFKDFLDLKQKLKSVQEVLNDYEA